MVKNSAWRSYSSSALRCACASVSASRQPARSSPPAFQHARLRAIHHNFSCVVLLRQGSRLAAMAAGRAFAPLDFYQILGCRHMGGTGQPKGEAHSCGPELRPRSDPASLACGLAYRDGPQAIRARCPHPSNIRAGDSDDTIRADIFGVTPCHGRSAPMADAYLKVKTENSPIWQNGHS